MKNLLFFAFITLLFSGIVACGQHNNGDALTEPKNVTSGKGVHPNMDPEKAEAAKGRWNTMRSYIVNNLNTTHFLDTNYVAKGFHVPFNDLAGILANIGDTTQLYAMLAIQDSADNPQKPMITLIFQAPDKNGTLRYYDFTLPCPKQCPPND